MGKGIGITILIFLISCNKGIEPNGWSHYRGDPAATQFSNLSQINKKSVVHLQPAWVYHTGETDAHGTIECNPIVVHGMMYLTSPHLSLIALDAVTGKEKWKFKPSSGENVNRGVNYYEDQNQKSIFFAAGYYMYCIDALSGALITSFGDRGKIDLRQDLGRDTALISVGMTTPGVIYKNILVLGSATGEGYEASPGDIRAYEVHTGKLVWSFHTIPHKGEEGYETWAWKAGENYGGVNAWGGLSLDEKNGIVFASTGSPTYDFYGANRSGDNLFGNCVIALDASTGKKRWHYQTVKHDLWDYDLPCAPTLASIEFKGQLKEIVMQPTKLGELILLDRFTGKPLLDTVHKAALPSDIPGERASQTQVYNQGIKLVSQGWDTSNVTNLSDSAKNYILVQARNYRVKGMFTPPSLQGTISYPGARGGFEWSGISYDAMNQVAYANCNNFPMIFQLGKISKGRSPSDPLYHAERVYMLNCAFCHGADRNGAGDFPSLRGVNNKYNDVQIKNLIRNGKGQMPAHTQLADTTLNQLVRFLKSNENTIQAPDTNKPSDKYSLLGFKIFTDREGFPANRPPWGTLNAIDLKTQSIKWTVPLGYYPKLKARGISTTGTQNFGGCVATAGGLIFIGATADEMFRAYDVEDGQELWSYKLPFGGYATPSIYQVNGKEFVVIAAGGGNRLNTPSGDAYIAFTLK